METFILIGVFALSWFCGILAAGQVIKNLDIWRKEGNSNALIATIAIALAIALVIILELVFLKSKYGLCTLAGFAVAAILIFDPFAMTQEHADRIGKEARRQEALKEQMEEQKMEDQKVRAENARIYAEEQKRLKKKK